MKKLFLIPLAVLFTYCACKKNIAESQLTTNLESVCPEDGKCTVEVYRNKSLDIKTDELKSIYYQLSDNPETSVILYQYNRNIIKGIEDSSYREEIIFEIVNTDSVLSLSNQDLQKTKMLYGRLCFCRGQTGYYKVTEGNLSLKQKNKMIQFELDFKNNKVPQIIQKIKATVK